MHDRPTLVRAFAVAAFILMALPVASRAVAFSASQAPALTLTQSVYSLAFDSHGNLWVSDGPQNEVVEYTAPVTSTSTPALTVSLSFSPSGIAFDPSGNMLVADYSGSHVFVITAPITATSVASGGFDISAANQMTFDSSGNLWIASGGAANQVVEIGNPATSPVLKNLINVGFNDPTDVAMDSSGNLWVSNYLSNNVAEFSASTLAACVGHSPCSPLATNVLSVTSPNSVAVDPSGNVWVVSNTGAKVVEFAPPYNTPTVTLTSGLSIDVTAVRADSSGNVWVADRGISKILEYAGSSPTQSGTPIPQSAVPRLLTFSTYGNSTVVGSLVGLIGDTQVVYNVPSINQTLLNQELAQGNLTLLLNAVTTCSTQVGGQDYIRVAGFFGGTWGGTGTNSTEYVFSDYQSFLTPAAGWPSQPACSS